MPSHLYFHLPYCRRKCPYCDFFKQVPHSGERERYVESLLTEMKLAFEQLPEFKQIAETVYLGGGTPSLHPPAEIGAILSQVRQFWGIGNPAEITLEANPGTLTTELLNGWRNSGVNRLSIGVQSFSQRKLHLLYRDHSTQDARDAVRYARDAGFENISADLIFGLPGENLEELRADLTEMLSLNPEHISLYSLEFHPGTPFDRWRRNGKMLPLSEDLEADLYLEIHNILSQAGFEHYEVSNFARPGRRSVHNQVYWTNQPYLGMGVSAHSFDGNLVRFSNVADLHRYFADIESGRLPLSDRHENTRREAQEEWISNALRRNDGIFRPDAETILGSELTAILWERAKELPVNLRELTDERLSLTPAGWFRENSVLLWLFEAIPSVEIKS
jgi:oxygen-independent coproporphyrinogen III oxidase